MRHKPDRRKVQSDVRTLRVQHDAETAHGHYEIVEKLGEGGMGRARAPLAEQLFGMSPSDPVGYLEENELAIRPLRHSSLHVAQAPQTVQLFRGHPFSRLAIRRQPSRRRHLTKGVDLLRQTLHDVGMSLSHIVGVERIFLPVEELELGPTAATLHVMNQLPPIGDDGRR